MAKVNPQLYCSCVSLNKKDTEELLSEHIQSSNQRVPLQHRNLVSVHFNYMTYFTLCKCSWPGECEGSHFSFSSPLWSDRPPSSSQRFSMNYQLFVCTSLQSCYLSKFCLNKSQWHFAIRQRAFQLWRRISKVRTVKCSNYCPLGFRPQSSNKFWMNFQEHFYAHAGESTIGGSLLCILQNASFSHLTVIVDMGRVGKTGGKSQNRTI